MKPYLDPGVPGKCWPRSRRRRFDSAPQQHAELVGLLVTNGSMQYLVDDISVTLTRGALLWVHSDQAHLLLSESDDFDMWIVVIARSTLHPHRLFPPVLVSDLDEPAGPRWISSNSVDTLAVAAAEIAAAIDPEALTVGLRWWTMQAWSIWRRADATAAARVHPAVRTAAELIRSDPTLTLGDVATEVGLSANRLGRIFKAQTQTTLAQFRSDQRLSAVDMMVADQADIGLTTAALAAGFGSYTQFYRVFVAARGVSPRRYYREQTGR